MSFNIFTTQLPVEEFKYYSDIWANRAEFNIKTIRRYDPDLIGFQEFDRGHQATYQGHFPEYDYYVAEVNGELQGNPIYWRSARFERLDAGVFWLTRTPSDPTPDWGLPYALSAQWALLRIVDKGAPLLVVNTQYEDGSDGELMRLEGSKIMLDKINAISRLAPGAPVILMGDFNCNPWSPPYCFFIEHGFVDSYRAAGHGGSVDSSTFHDFRGKDYFSLEYGNDLFWRVDWIVTRNGQQRILTGSCSIIHDAEPPVYASDHYPVLAEFQLVKLTTEYTEITDSETGRSHMG